MRSHNVLDHRWLIRLTSSWMRLIAEVCFAQVTCKYERSCEALLLLFTQLVFRSLYSNPIRFSWHTCQSDREFVSGVWIICAGTRRRNNRQKPGRFRITCTDTHKHCLQVSVRMRCLAYGRQHRFRKVNRWKENPVIQLTCRCAARPGHTKLIGGSSVLNHWVGVQRPSDHWNLRWIQIGFAPVENKCDVCSAAHIICVTSSQTPHQLIWK